MKARGGEPGAVPAGPPSLDKGRTPVTVIVRVLVATALAVCRRQRADGLDLVSWLLHDALVVLDELDDDKARLPVG